MDNQFYLYKSKRKGKKYMMKMPSYNHTHHFGGLGYRDYTLLHNKNSRTCQPWRTTATRYP